MKITVVGMGYVGLSVAVLLARRNEVTAVDVVKSKVDALNERRLPVKDKEMEDVLASEKIDLTATTDARRAYEDADFIVVATPTDYDEEKNGFDTSSVDDVISAATKVAPDATVVVRSTVPVGYTERIRKELCVKKILFCPEFLREGKALYDNLYPTRIVVGSPKGDEASHAAGRVFAGLLNAAARKTDVATVFMPATEAEAVKLFSNSYLALRVSFFNELDTYADAKGLDCASIIKGVCLDGRIGDYYNVPSFGYGGYCLPKDVRQLLSGYGDVPQEIVSAIVRANRTRKDYIAHRIAETGAKVVGFFRLTMKAGSDNLRCSAARDVMRRIVGMGIKAVVYEPLLTEETLSGCRVLRDLDEFKKISDVIVADRYDGVLDDVKEKVFTRDISFRR